VPNWDVNDLGKLFQAFMPWQRYLPQLQTRDVTLTRSFADPIRELLLRESELKAASLDDLPKSG
jgi:hypothetical protein